MVGSAIVRKLQKEGYKNLLLRTSKRIRPPRSKSSSVIFLKVRNLTTFSSLQQKYILANNTYPATFL
ncbi:MAG: hypothetical protein M9898_15060 [Chitinophagaceae bacterium]|nr:hypothetical protein [Chitinophagaceae bacterium]